MHINSINSINFKGYVDRNLADYVRKQSGVLIENEISSMDARSNCRCILNVDRINSQADRIIEKFEKKAGEMNKTSYIGIKSSNAKKTGCRIYSGNTRLQPYGKNILPVSYAKTKTPLEKEHGFRTFETAKHIELQPEEAKITLERLEELADNFNPDETDKKILSSARTGILNNLQEHMNDGGQINVFVQKDIKKASKTYDKLKTETEGVKEAKKSSLLKHVSGLIRQYNKRR